MNQSVQEVLNMNCWKGHCLWSIQIQGKTFITVAILSEKANLLYKITYLLIMQTGHQLIA